MRPIERSHHRSPAATAGTRARPRPACALALAGWVAIVGCATVGSPVPAPAQESTVLLVSDFHFNPFASGNDVVKALRSTPTSQWAGVLAASPNTAPSAPGSDTNYPLLVSAGAAIRAAAPNPAFVVITGDFLSHHFETGYSSVFGDTAGVAAFADSTMAFMAGFVGSLVPANVPVYPSIGNNDSGCGDYDVDPQFLRSAARSWAPLAERGGGAPGFVAAFDSGGWYTARPPATGVTLLVLNDVYWSRDYAASCGPDLGIRQLQWVGQELASTRTAGGRAWLAAHIPPGVDIYSSLDTTPVLMFDTPYAAPYDSTVRANADVVRLQLTGHTHMNEFRVYATTGGGGVPDVGVPAVSPVFYNNPGFVTMRLSAAGEVLDYTAHAFTGATSPNAPAGWSTLFDFDALYRQPAVTGASLRAAAALIASDPTVRAAWELNYSGGAEGQNPTSATWQAYWCGIQNLDASSYQACVQGGAGPGPTP